MLHFALMVLLSLCSISWGAEFVYPVGDLGTTLDSDYENSNDFATTINNGGYCSSNYNLSHENCTGTWMYGHDGIDLNHIDGGSSDCGKDVYASGDGTILYAGWYGNGWGYLVRIQHDTIRGTFVTHYAHLQDIESSISVGGSVTQGQKIGSIGGTSTENTSYPCHLHFGVMTDVTVTGAGYYYGNEIPSTIIDPVSFIEDQDCTLTTQPLETSSRMMVQMVVTEKNGDYFDFNAYFKERIGSGDNDMVELEECVDDSYLDDICAPDVGNPVIEGEGSYTNKNKWLVGNVGGSAHDDMVLITHVDGGFKAHVWISNGDGTFDTRERWLHKSSTQRDLYFLGDYDDDGDDDLITAHDNSSGKVTWNVYKSNGSSAFSSSATSWHSSFGNSTSDEFFLVGDVSGDGKVDIVRGYEASDITDTCSTDGTTKLKWRVVKGGSSSASTWASDGWGCGTSDYMLGDASGDGKDDLIQIRYESDGDARAFVRTSSGSSFNTGSRWRSDFGTNDWRFYVWDVNRDGYDDLIRYRKSTEKMIMGYSTGSSFGTASDELHDSITLTTKNAIRFGQFAYLYMYDGGEEVCE